MSSSVSRVKTAAGRWRKSYNEEGLLGLKDSRKEYSGRSKSRELTDSEKMEKIEAKIRLLEIENEFLAYEVSDNLKLELATNTIEKLCRKRFKLAEGCFIH